MKNLELGRIAAAIAAALLAAGVLAACGSDEEGGGDEADAEAAALDISAGETQNGDAEITAPESAEAGLTDITLTNDGDLPHSAQLVRVEGEHDEDEVLDAFVAVSEGKAFPDWFFAGGGVGPVAPGESATVTQNLEAGSTYWVVDDEARGGLPPLAPVEITGESGDEELSATDNVVTAVDFGFEAEPLTAGEKVTFRNDGEQPHHMIAFPITDEDATIQDVENFFREEKGQAPVEFDQSQGTSVLEGGDAQVSAAELEPGRWALACFISNREGGPPHIQLGMLDEVEVE